MAKPDLVALWEEHCRREFATRDANATMATMVAEPYVNQQGMWYHVSVSAFGPDITVYINGAQVLHYVDTDAPVFTGRIGLAGFTGANVEGGQHVQFDNVRVYVPTVATQPTTWGRVKALYRTR